MLTWHGERVGVVGRGAELAKDGDEMAAAAGLTGKGFTRREWRGKGWGESESSDAATGQDPTAPKYRIKEGTRGKGEEDEQM